MHSCQASETVNGQNLTKPEPVKLEYNYTKTELILDQIWTKLDKIGAAIKPKMEQTWTKTRLNLEEKHIQIGLR